MTDKLVMTKHFGQPPNERTVEIYERSQIVPIGAIMAPTVVECYFLLQAPVHWPKIQIRTRRGFAKWFAKSKSQSGILLDDDNFNRTFKVSSKDKERGQDFAIMLLTPELQRFMLEKQGVDWSVGEGAIKLWYRGKLKKKKADRAVDRLAHFESLIPDALYAYE